MLFVGNSDGRQSSSSDGAEYIKRKQVRPSKKTSKSKSSVKGQTNSKKKRRKSVPPPKRVQGRSGQNCLYLEMQYCLKFSSLCMLHNDL